MFKRATLCRRPSRSEQHPLLTSGVVMDLSKLNIKTLVIIATDLMSSASEDQVIQVINILSDDQSPRQPYHFSREEHPDGATKYGKIEAIKALRATNPDKYYVKVAKETVENEDTVWLTSTEASDIRRAIYNTDHHLLAGR